MDTNVVVEYLNGAFPPIAKAFLVEAFHPKPNISIITAIELLSWVIPDKKKEEQVRSFVDNSSVTDLSAEIATMSVKIRRSKRVKMPDAIIAATAMVEGLTLIRSDEGFRTIDGLRFFGPGNDFL